MKRLALVSLLFFVGPYASAQVGVGLGLGLNSDKGLMGIGVDYKFQNQSLIQLDAGLDRSGLIQTLMYKYPLYSHSSGSQWYSKCLFLFDCDMIVYLGAGIKYFTAYSVQFRKGEAAETQYDVDPKYATGFTLTLRDEYKNGLFFDLDISYRARLTKPDIHLKSGSPLAEDEDKIRASEDSFGFGLVLGYRF